MPITGHRFAFGAEQHADTGHRSCVGHAAGSCADQSRHHPLDGSGALRGGVLSGRDPAWVPGCNE